MDSNTANDLAQAREIARNMLEAAHLALDEHARLDRAAAIVREALPGPELQKAIEVFRDYEKRGWVMVALPPDVASQIIGLPVNQQNAYAFMGNLKAKIALLEMSSETTGWRVVDSASEGWVLLAHPDYDGPTGHRLAVPVVPMEGSEVELGGSEVEQTVHQVFPCRRCGWEHTCEDEGGCHS